MQYSLSSRFQGGVLGNVIGQGLNWGHQGQQQLIFNKNELCPWQDINRCLLKSLIQQGKLDLGDWIELIARRHSSLLDLRQKATSAEVAIATLPIMLFCHESPAWLREQLYEAAHLWLHPQERITNVEIFAGAIALALSEKLLPSQLIPQLLSAPNFAQTPLGEILHEFQQDLTNRIPLQTVITRLQKQSHLSENALGIALYCFLSTPEDFRLGVTRAVRVQSSFPLSRALTGALSGVYNSLSGIPIFWRSQAHSASLKELAEHLFTVWSGVYFPNASNPLLLKSAIASPRVIQPRTSLNIISQRE